MKENFNPSVYPREIVGHLLISLLFCLSISLLNSCSRIKTRERVYNRTQFMMGTIVEIKVVASDPDKADLAISMAFERMRQIEDLMNAKVAGSWLDRMSTEAMGMPMKVPPEIIEVIDLCQQYSARTEGAFDISIGSLTRLWQFDKGMHAPPDAKEVSDALPSIDFRQIQVDKLRDTIELGSKGMHLDLGGAAKGYAVDRGVEVIKGMGIKAGIVNAGGNLRAFGRKPDGNPWNIGIQDPEYSDRIIGSLCLTDISLSTSGDYERYIMYEGVRYHHILDPKTGWPARGCKSVSISCPRAVEADILSTAVFVLGPEKGMALIEDLPHVEGMIIDAKGGILISSGWKESLKLLPGHSK